MPSIKKNHARNVNGSCRRANAVGVKGRVERHEEARRKGEAEGGDQALGGPLNEVEVVVKRGQAEDAAEQN